eukprot:Opistho-2@57390
MSFEDVVSGRRHGDAQPTEDTSNSSMEGLDTLESLNERFDALGLALTVHMRKVESSCSRLLKLGEHVGSMRREDVSEITRALAAEKGRASASSGEMHRILAELSGIVALMAEWGDFEAVHNKMRELYLQYGRVAEMFSRASKMVNTIRLECQGSPAFMGRSIQTSSSVDGNMPSSTSNGGLHADAYGSMRQRTASSSQGSQGRATGGQAQTQVHVPIVVVDGRREQEFDSLVHELKELHGLFAELAGHVQREAVQVNTIEQHIVEAKAHMQQGNSDLKAVSTLAIGLFYDAQRSGMGCAEAVVWIISIAGQKSRTM